MGWRDLFGLRQWQRKPTSMQPNAAANTDRAGGRPATEDAPATVTPSAKVSSPAHVYLLEATEVDVAAAIRAIEGVSKVTRDADGAWRIVADREVAPLMARRIVAAGGEMTMLVSAARYSAASRSR